MEEEKLLLKISVSNYSFSCEDHTNEISNNEAMKLIGFLELIKMKMLQVIDGDAIETTREPE